MIVEIDLPYIAEIEATGFNVATDHPLYFVALAGYIYCKVYQEAQNELATLIMPKEGHIADVQGKLDDFTTEQQALIDEIYPLFNESDGNGG